MIRKNPVKRTQPISIGESSPVSVFINAPPNAARLRARTRSRMPLRAAVGVAVGAAGLIGAGLIGAGLIGAAIAGVLCRMRRAAKRQLPARMVGENG
jgi:hypothetical protein